MALVHDGHQLVFKVAGMGAYNNNGYVIADPATKEAYLIDAPADVKRLLEEADGFDIKGVVVTHTHADHVAGYADLKRLTGLPVGVHERDAGRLPGKPDFLLAHNEELHLGGVSIRVLHTPGHTPGALCLHTDGVLVSGDTLFPGGPGRTNTPDDLRQVVSSIEERLLVMDDGTLVLPGHGQDTTIRTSREEYAVFKRNAHPADLHGHVSWLTS